MDYVLRSAQFVSFTFILCVLGACGDDAEIITQCDSSSQQCVGAHMGAGGEEGMSGDAGLTRTPTDGSLGLAERGDIGEGPGSQSQSNMVSLNENEVQLTTRLGDIIIRVNPELAPLSSENFLQYVDDGFYDGQDGGGVTVFHRVISGFMVQGGGLLDTGDRKPTRAPILNESMNGLQNLRGTVAMARTSNPNSATSQFFINHIDNPFLDYAPDNVGYAVFGEVVSGMETVDAIATQAVGANDVPRTLIYIEQVRRWSSL